MALDKHTKAARYVSRFANGMESVLTELDIAIRILEESGDCPTELELLQALRVHFRDHTAIPGIEHYANARPVASLTDCLYGLSRYLSPLH